MKKVPKNPMPEHREAVRKIVARYISDLISVLKDAKGHFTSWLRPIQKGAQQKYRKFGTDMVLFCIGLALGKFKNCQVPVAHDQKTAAKKLVRALQSDEEKQEKDNLQRSSIITQYISGIVFLAEEQFAMGFGN
ncbi:hypothetical protein BJ322DRAFT_1015841 [Thelephora terrestris]|uniref:Uncharacterized protein n=1 Tax=Thelephora terrestris TaxID=56493 RepID=A0A9P6LBN8_9AGAM|nr:hypothetical protein BJ322DRAFT_1015841 [Thelephora terrestris]